MAAVLVTDVWAASGRQWVVITCKQPGEEIIIHKSKKVSYEDIWMMSQYVLQESSGWIRGLVPFLKASYTR